VIKLIWTVKWIIRWALEMFCELARHKNGGPEGFWRLKAGAGTRSSQERKLPDFVCCLVFCSQPRWNIFRQEFIIKKLLLYGRLRFWKKVHPYTFLLLYLANFHASIQSCCEKINIWDCGSSSIKLSDWTLLILNLILFACQLFHNIILCNFPDRADDDRLDMS
jgi:hypothetical protein